MKEGAVALLVGSEDGQFRLDEAALGRLLGGHEDYVVVVSVAGVFRKGKSFLLDYCLRHLQTGGLGPEEAPLEGFSWRGGSERDTTGLLAWPTLFPATLPSGERVSLLLLDTQGSFDSQSTLRQAATVFAMSTLVSSVQVYNLSQNIQEDDLHHLQLFADYGRLASTSSSSTPFQKLVFLVRDWSYPYEAPYGELGGRVILERRLRVTSAQHPELQSLRKHIASCFSDITCFLMPHPGKKVATDPSFDGRPCDLDPEFKLVLSDFLKNLLNPDKLVIKEIAGEKIKVRDLPFYFRAYLNIFTGDNLPHPKTILSATAEANNLAALASAKDSYYNTMKGLCGPTKPYLRTVLLQHHHAVTKSQVLQDFIKKPKMGGIEFSETYQSRLEEGIEEMYRQFGAFNDSKNLSRALLTPMVLISCAVVFYVLSGLLSLVGMTYVASLCSLLMGVALVTMMTWGYVRYTGDLPDMGQLIDVAILSLWETVLKPLYMFALEDTLSQVAISSSLTITDEKMLLK